MLHCVGDRTPTVFLKKQIGDKSTTTTFAERQHPDPILKNDALAASGFLAVFDF
jgi:hypothetical protein